MDIETISRDVLPQSAASLACCIDCGRRLQGRSACLGCGRSYEDRDGILQAVNPLSGRNRIAAEFYDGPGWARFRPWERLFLSFQGGQDRARRQILRHLPDRQGLRVLEVGIGDGENLQLLPDSWEVFGVDCAPGRLRACLDRFPRMAGRLVLAEAEALPFEDGTFDAVFSVGGFNYFRDHAKALEEIRRVAGPRATMVIADEVPDLVRFSIGRLLGVESLNRWSLRMLGLDREFVAMVLGLKLDLDALARRIWPGHRRLPIWNRLGYCLVESQGRTSAGESRRNSRCRSSRR